MTNIEDTFKVNYPLGFCSSNKKFIERNNACQVEGLEDIFDAVDNILSVGEGFKIKFKKCEIPHFFKFLFNLSHRS